MSSQPEERPESEDFQPEEIRPDDVRDQQIIPPEAEQDPIQEVEFLSADEELEDADGLTAEVEDWEDEDELDDEAEAREPVLVIRFYSWAVPVVAVLLLVLGLAGGYFAPVLIDAARQAAGSPPAAAAPGAQAADGEVAETPARPDAPAGTEEGSGVTEEQRQEIMDFMIGMTRHFKGDPEAQVTIIEFSDFQ